MSEQKKNIIVVFGATGAQGGSVVKSLLKDGNYAVRGVTRDPTSEKAQALVAQGVEMVKGDINALDESVLAGAFGTFVLTNFWDPSQMGKEVSILQGVAEACRTANVQHAVLATLPDVEAESKGKWNVPHLTHKAQGARFFFNMGIPVTRVEVGCYYQNFGTFFTPQEVDGTDTYTFPPIAKLTTVDVRDTGDAVLAAFNNPAKWLGRRILIGGDHQPTDYYIQLLGKKSGRPTKLNTVSVEDFGKFPFPGAEELAQMFGYFDEFTVFGASTARGEMSTFEEATGRAPRTFAQYLELE